MPTLRQYLRNFALGQQPHVKNVARVQERRVRELARHVYEHVPFYRDLYRAHKIDIDSIVTPNDLWRLPSVTKNDYIRAGPLAYVDERVRNSLADLSKQTTSGSLGAMLTIYATRPEAERQLASLWAGWIGAGVTPRDRLLMMSAWYLEDKIPPFQSTFIPVQMPIDEVIRRFEQFRPTVIIGMVESIALLARELVRRQINSRHDVRAIFVFGQTYSAQLREMIESGFSATVSILYGSAETGWLGYECSEHNGLHVPEGRVVLHIARTGKPDEPAQPNEIGEVIVTSLLRDTTPFVRYRLHDVAALDPAPCPCGRTSPRLTNLEGRVQDFLVARDGHWVGPGTVAIDLFLKQHHIVDHRIVQDAPDHVRMSLVLVDDLSASERERMTGILRRHLGEVKIDIERVNEIPRDPSGKRRRVFRMFDLPDAA
jgi:phenylacetate-CoA ligase